MTSRVQFKFEFVSKNPVLDSQSAWPTVAMCCMNRVTTVRLMIWCSCRKWRIWDTVGFGTFVTIDSLFSSGAYSSLTVTTFVTHSTVFRIESVSDRSRDTVPVFRSTVWGRAHWRGVRYRWRSGTCAGTSDARATSCASCSAFNETLPVPHALSLCLWPARECGESGESNLFCIDQYWQFSSPLTDKFNMFHKSIIKDNFLLFR